MYKFKPYGPFPVPVEDGRVVEQELKIFWREIEERHSGLSSGIGCYIFGAQTAKSSRPWYVGKTERRSFKGEAFQVHKLHLYQNAVLNRIGQGTPVLYLIARLTPSGKLRKAASGEQGVGSVKLLEQLLIGNCLRKNPDLANKANTIYLKRMRVPGFLNDTPGAPSREAKALAKVIG